MFGHNKKPRPETIYTGYGFCLLGVIIIMVIIVIPMSRRISLRQRGEPVVGIIDSIPRHPTGVNIGIRVRYIVDGQEFFRSLDERGFRMRPGQEILLFYDPNDPRNITTGRPPGLDYILMFGGIALIGSGISIIIRQGRKEQREQAEAEEDFR